MPDDPHREHLRLKQVLRQVPVSKSTWYAGIPDRFPPPVIKTGRISMWRQSDIDALVRRLEKEAAAG